MRHKSDVFSSLIGKVIVPKIKISHKKNKRVRVPKVLSREPRIIKHSKPQRNYRKYIKSKAWLRRRISYYEKYGKTCVICGAINVHLHHLSYEQLGREPDEDLIALCELHHDRLHEQVSTRRGNLRFNSFQFIIDERESDEFTQIVKNF